MPGYRAALDQSTGNPGVVEPMRTRGTCWKIIGTPGEVKATAAPRTERFFAKTLSGSAGSISAGTRVPPLASASCDSVNTTLLNASLPYLRSTIVQMALISAFVEWVIQHAPDNTNQVGIPLAVEAGAARRGGCGDLDIVAHVLGDTNPARMLASDLFVDRLQQ